MSVVSIAQVRNRVGPVSADDEINRLQPMMNAAIEAFVLGTGREVRPQIKTYRFNPTEWQRTLHPGAFPIVSLVSAKHWDRDTKTEAEATVIDVAGLELDAPAGMIRNPDGWYSTVLLELKAGWHWNAADGYTQTPADVIEGIVEQVAFMHEQAKGDRAVASKGGRGGSVTYLIDREICPPLARAIKRWKRLRVM